MPVSSLRLSSLRLRHRTSQVDQDFVDPPPRKLSGLRQREIAKRVDPNIVKLNRNYDASQLAACCGVHKNSVLNWRNAGLEPIDSSKPIVFHCSVVRDFLRKRNAKRKRPCGPGRLYSLNLPRQHVGDGRACLARRRVASGGVAASPL